MKKPSNVAVSAPVIEKEMDKKFSDKHLVTDKKESDKLSKGPGSGPAPKPFQRASEQTITSYETYLKKEQKRFPIYYEKNVSYNETLNDFERITTLGAGTYGRVMLVKSKRQEKFYALKILEKRKVVVLEQIEHTLNEKRILSSTNHPFMVYMAFFFSDNSYLYFVLPFINGGEMFGLLKKKTCFEEPMAKFYAAQVCLALEYLHEVNIVYRDLKPENILIDESGYIKVTDFGFAKLIFGRTYTLCGTPEYLAPEIVLSRGYSFAVDWWSFGILIFELNAGHAPFQHKDPLQLYDKIASGKYKVPMDFSIGLRDLLRNILQVDLTKRFGNLSNKANDIKEHRWFKEINWLAVFNKKIEPPYMPSVKSPKDTSHFDKFEDEPLVISNTPQFEKEFEGF